MVLGGSTRLGHRLDPLSGNCRTYHRAFSESTRGHGVYGPMNPGIPTNRGTYETFTIPEVAFKIFAVVTEFETIFFAVIEPNFRT